MRAWWLAAWLLAAAPAGAEVVSAAPESATLTIYREWPTDTQYLTDPERDVLGTAMVTETRTVQLPAGRSRLVFKDVADGLMPHTAKLEGLPGGVIEQNFDYDVLTPKALFAKSIGKSVRLIRVDPVTGVETEATAIVRSASDEVVLEIDGRIEPLKCSGLAERIVFDRIPDGMTAGPTLSLNVYAPAAGRYVLKLAYLSTGFDWSVDYAARINPNGRTLDLSGAMTLINGNTTGFTNIPVQVISGRLNRIYNYDNEWEPEKTPTPCLWAARSIRRKDGIIVDDLYALDKKAEDDDGEVQELVVTGSRIPNTRRIGDYHLYALPETTTVAPRQVKQVALLEMKGVSFQRGYYYALDPTNLDEDRPLDEEADVVLRMKNDKASNLGQALPAGVVSVMETTRAGRIVLAGESSIADTPEGVPLELTLGGAPDVRIGTRLISDTEFGPKDKVRRRREIEVTVYNGKSAPIDFELAHGAGPDFRMVRESRRHQIKYGGPVWALRVKAGGRAVVRYTVEQED
jgi:hypothetical protein